MRGLIELSLHPRLEIYQTGADGCAGIIHRVTAGIALKFIASWGSGWDHVSVSPVTERRCPTWEEMCVVREIFFLSEERVVQYHPPASEYVKAHPYALHLWRWQAGELPHPPYQMVGGLTAEENKSLAEEAGYERGVL